MANKDTKLQEGAVLAELVRSDGWQLIESFIHTQIQNDTSQLTQPSTKEIEEIRFLQGRINGCQFVLQKVQDRINLYRKG